MQRTITHAFMTLCLALAITFLLSREAPAWHILHSYEFGVGAGKNIDGEETDQYLFYPSVNWFLEKYPHLIFRLEGDFEVIVDGHTVYIGGLAPFLRYAVPLKSRWKPFGEVGTGANIISRNEAGERKLGGAFHFSFMAGVGVEYTIEGEKAVRLSSRFRHLSNAKLYPENQSINEILFVLAFGF